MEIQWPKHKLSIKATHRPEVATEGEEFTITYIIKNIGDDSFPGGNLNILCSSSSMSQNVSDTDPIAINKPVSPGSIFLSNDIKHTAFVAGYTFFQVISASSKDTKKVEVYLPNGRRLWPSLYPPYSQIFHAMRTRSYEEISQRKVVWIAILSLAVIAGIQIVDWLIRFFMKI